ncbi:GTP-binding protein [Coemansia spiralis]|uniref:GTP-binding protein n=2 Tax=Coemansia TaxID=4863 RepID=A0A9W8G352_9FUNG|nr:P-loop containing nucleoside triphosphate hydrolase protein [Coemansia spiralis]KAJ1987263.1 GTP-binding protein [Coemansia umbellata]KAJ2619145.1 GTP-binding protein [Coemansia sp. RSA 1358]KAJ2670058.1 GTP-binding protein [Coemansia spiralis]
MSSQLLDRNVIVLGGMNVGKSTAIQRFLGNEFMDKYKPTVKDTHNKKLNLNDVEYNLTITDTAGQDETSLLDTSFVGSADVYVIVFSLSFRKSFEVAKVIRDKILDISGIETIAMVLVGNKSDLKADRQVSFAEAQALAQSYGCPYVETSAKENLNIKDVFISSVKIANRARGVGEDAEDADGSDKPMCILM